MNIVKENTDELNAVIKIQCKEEDYKPKVEKVLNEYRKNAVLPGFRPGKVPFSIIEKKYGLAVKADEINKLISESLNRYIHEQGLKILGHPLPSKEHQPLDIVRENEFEFVFDIGLSPQFTVNLTSRDKFTYYDIIIDDELLDKNINDVRKRYGNVRVADISEEQDMVQGEFTELDADGRFKEDGIHHMSMILIDTVDDKTLKESLIGVKRDDKLILDPGKLSKGDADLAAMLGTEKKKLADISDRFQFKVTNIYRMFPAEINQELFDKVFGKDVVKSPEEFRGKVKEELSRVLQSESDAMMRKDIVEKCIEKLKISIPDDFLKRWLAESGEKKIAPEEIEKEYGKYAQNLKWQLVESRIISENNLQIQHNEALDYTKSLIAEQMRQYGQQADDEDKLTEAAENILQKEEEAGNIYTRLYDKKLIAFYKATCTFKHKEITYDDFINLATGKTKKFRLFDNISNLINPKNAK